MDTIAGAPQGIDCATHRRLSQDIQSALEGLDPRERSKLVGACATAAMRETAANKVDVAKSLVRKAPGAISRAASLAASAGSRAIDRAQQPMPTSAEVARSVGRVAKFGVTRATHSVASLRQLTPQELTQFMMTWIVAFASAGGSDIEGGLPDTDLLFGIGNHRNLFSHTILLGLTVETALRFAYLLLEALTDRMPQDRSAVWATALEYAGAARSGSILGAWLGIGAHFIKDSGLIAGGFKPYTGIQGQTMEFHQTLMAANGVAATSIGYPGNSLPE